MRTRLTSFMSWAVIFSEISHVFCCVLPTLFSIMTVLAGLGLLAAAPGFLVEWHDVLHAYELPIIAASGVITALAWVVYANADKVDCHETGCGHPPCGPRKDRAGTVLKIGTALFAVNLFIFVFLHYLPGKGVYSLDFGHEAAHHAHDGHDHEHDHGHAH